MSHYHVSLRCKLADLKFKLSERRCPDADISSIEKRKRGRRDVEGIFRNSFSEWRKSHLILCTQHITDKFLCPEGDAMAIL